MRHIARITFVAVVLAVPLCVRAGTQERALGMKERYEAKAKLTPDQSTNYQKNGSVSPAGSEELASPPDASIKSLLGASELAVFGGTSVVPTIMARARFQKRDYLRFAGGALVGVPATKADSLQDGTSLFIDSASKLSVGIWGAWKPKSKGRVSKEFAVTGGVAYDRKDLMQSDTTGTDAGMLRFVLGVEVIPVADNLSFYANLNVSSVQQNVGQFEARFGAEAPRTFIYGEYGLKARLENDDLFVDLSLVVLNNDMRTITGTKDGVIPVARIGFSHDFFN